MLRKLKQIDNFNELPKEKVPPDDLIWNGTQEELEQWIDKVVRNKEPQTFKLDVGEIEG